MPRAESDEERVTEAACLRDTWGYLTTVSRVTWCAHLATLCRFDRKVQGMVKTRPLIPCERRLGKMEIREFQEVTFWARFGNRDYGRPYAHILVTLCRFD